MAKKTKSKEIDNFEVSAEFEKFNDEIGEFLEKNAKINCEDLSEFGDVPYWIPTRCYPLNWIISNEMRNGMPGTKVIVIQGQCIDGDTELEVKIPNKIVEFGKAHNIF